MREGKLLPIDRFPTNIIIIIMWEGNLPHFDRFPTKKKLQLCERAIYYLLTDSRQKNNYNYERGYLLPIDRFQTKTIITIMWKGNLLPFARFQKKKNITIMWDGNLLHFDRFQTKKLLQLCERAIYYLLTDSRQKNYNYARGQITTYWQIPDKYNNYNYVRGKLTTFWQIPDKKNNYNYARGQFTTVWQIPDQKIITIMWEAIYYLVTVSRQKQ